MPLDMLRPAFVFVQAAMMFIQQYPVVVIMRSTNLYRKRGLGIHREDLTYNDVMREDVHPSFTRLLARRFKREEQYVFLRGQLRHPVMHDMLLVFIATILISVLETYLNECGGKGLASDVFGCIKIGIEVVSSYGSVGLSWGLANTAYR